MFFHFALVNKKDPLSSAWHAGNHLRVSKSQATTADLSVIIKSLRDPSVPISLRIRGICLEGVCILHSVQVRALLKDCQDAHLALLQHKQQDRVVVELNARAPQLVLDCVVPLQSITLADPTAASVLRAHFLATEDLSLSSYQNQGRFLAEEEDDGDEQEVEKRHHERTRSSLIGYTTAQKRLSRGDSDDWWTESHSYGLPSKSRETQLKIGRFMEYNEGDKMKSPTDDFIAISPLTRRQTTMQHTQDDMGISFGDSFLMGDGLDDFLSLGHRSPSADLSLSFLTAHPPTGRDQEEASRRSTAISLFDDDAEFAPNVGGSRSHPFGADDHQPQIGDSPSQESSLVQEIEQLVRHEATRTEGLQTVAGLRRPIKRARVSTTVSMPPVQMEGKKTTISSKTYAVWLHNTAPTVVKRPTQILTADAKVSLFSLPHSLGGTKHRQDHGGHIFELDEQNQTLRGGENGGDAETNSSDVQRRVANPLSLLWKTPAVPQPDSRSADQSSHLNDRQTSHQTTKTTQGDFSNNQAEDEGPVDLNSSAAMQTLVEAGIDPKEALFLTEKPSPAAQRSLIDSQALDQDLGFDSFAMERFRASDASRSLLHTPLLDRLSDVSTLRTGMEPPQLLPPPPLPASRLGFPPFVPLATMNQHQISPSYREADASLDDDLSLLLEPGDGDQLLGISAESTSAGRFELPDLPVEANQLPDSPGISISKPHRSDGQEYFRNTGPQQRKEGGERQKEHNEEDDDEEDETKQRNEGKQPQMDYVASQFLDYLKYHAQEEEITFDEALNPTGEEATRPTRKAVARSFFMVLFLASKNAVSVRMTDPSLPFSPIAISFPPAR